MKLTKVHLIIILALALILCPILGVCSNMREGMVEGKGVNVTEGTEGIEEGDYDDQNFASG
jgi:hypothetical protein